MKLPNCSCWPRTILFMVKLPPRHAKEVTPFCRSVYSCSEILMASPILSELLPPWTVAHLWVKIFLTPLNTWTSQIPLNMGKALTGETWNLLSHKCTFCVDGRSSWVGSKCFQPIPSIKLNYIIFCHKHTEVDTTALHFPEGNVCIAQIHPNPLQ